MTQQSFTLDKTADNERIAKRIARAGICSRREAESRILDGRVKVNGNVITSPALNVNHTTKLPLTASYFQHVNRHGYGGITSRAAL